MKTKLSAMVFGLCCAGLIAFLSGFASEKMVAPQPLKSQAAVVEASVPAAPEAPVAAATPAAEEQQPVEQAAAPAPAEETPAVVTEAVATSTETVTEATPVAAPAAVAGPEPILDMIAKADAARGKTVAKACQACHTFDKGGKNGVGPNLYGVVGRKKESVAGFKYSGSYAKAGGPNWTYEELNKMLWKPKAYAPTTKMAYAGLKKPEDRAALLAYLRTLSDAPVAEPSAADIAQEKKDLGAK